jgi:signal transduction histidine kinase
MNLIQNASEAFDEERTGHVTVRAECIGQSLRVTIADDGRGMSPEILANIFQPLFSTKTKGTGLGLSIVEGTVKRHGAKIEVESRPGEGTTFLVELGLDSHTERSNAGEEAHANSPS